MQILIFCLFVFFVFFFILSFYLFLFCNQACEQDISRLVCQSAFKLSNSFKYISIGGTRNTSCAIRCLEIKAFFDYKMLHDGYKTITNGVLDNTNNRVFKLLRLDNFDLHRNLT